MMGRVFAFAGMLFWSFEGSAQTPPAASFPDAESPPPATTTPPPAATTPPPAQPAPAPAGAPSAATPAAAPPASIAPPEAAPIAEPPIPSEPKERPHYVSLTISPLHLLSPILELQVEGMVTPHFGLAALGGYGSIKATATNSALENTRFTAYELGLQLVGYPLRDFSSLQLGAELLWLKISTDSLEGREISGNAGGLAIGPFIGYKLLTNGGFTFFVQGGFQYIAAQADVADTEGNTGHEEASTIIPLLNLNLGWSF